jgi:ribosomal protein S18 acetylase RimI-like enzyme
MIRRLDLSDREELLEILDLQRAAYVVEGRLIGSYEIPPLRDTAETLGRCGETFYGYFSQRRKLVGAISYKKEEAVVDIHRLVVHPDHFRRGIARSLIGHIEEVEDVAERVVVSTGVKNLPAERLYRGLGFHETGRVEPVPGLLVTSFQKPLRGSRPRG